MSQQNVDDVAVTLIIASFPAGCPADYLELMIVTAPDNISARIDQSFDNVSVTGCCSPVHWISLIAFLLDVRIEPAFQKQIDRGKTAGMRRRVKQRPFVGCVSHIEPAWILIQQCSELFRIAIACGTLELSIDSKRIDVILQRAPACEAILLCDVELRVGELRIGSCLAKRLEPPFRFLAKPLEVRFLGERHHKPPFLSKGLDPFMAPTVRIEGKE
jgi:hypothetical protein